MFFGEFHFMIKDHPWLTGSENRSFQIGTDVQTLWFDLKTCRFSSVDSADVLLPTTPKVFLPCFFEHLEPSYRAKVQMRDTETDEIHQSRTLMKFLHRTKGGPDVDPWWKKGPHRQLNKLSE